MLKDFFAAKSPRPRSSPSERTMEAWDFHVAIPSRGRVHEFYLQTYRKIVYRYSLEKETTIFVQTEEDLQAYAEAYPRVKVVLTPGEGLEAAQEAIRRHYPPKTRVVVLHDDVTRVVRLRDGLIRRFDDVRRLFRVFFEVMETYGLSLGGMAPTTNAMTELETLQKVTLSLRFVYDPLHFELIREEPLTMKSDSKHDAERSIHHYRLSGGVLRVASFGVSTKHKPSVRHRAADAEDCARMKLDYSDEIFKVKTHRGGYSSLILKPLPYRGPLSLHGGGSLSSAVCESEAEALFKGKLGDFDVTPDLEVPGGRLLDLFQRFAWNINELRTSVVPPERRVVSVSKRNKLESLRVDMPLYSYSMHEGEIFDACAALLPSGVSFDFVTVNKNICCYPHRDVGNVGTSLILFLGKFEGGALCTEEGTRFEETGVFHAFDGSRLHWNEPLTGGTKYSVVYYNRSSANLRSNLQKLDSPTGLQDVGAAAGKRVVFDLYDLTRLDVT